MSKKKGVSIKKKDGIPKDNNESIKLNISFEEAMKKLLNKKDKK